jgi:hypothetical protein
MFQKVKILNTFVKKLKSKTKKTTVYEEKLHVFIGYIPVLK